MFTFTDLKQQVTIHNQLNKILVSRRFTILQLKNICNAIQRLVYLAYLFTRQVSNPFRSHGQEWIHWITVWIRVISRIQASNVDRYKDQDIRIGRESWDQNVNAEDIMGYFIKNKRTIKWVNNELESQTGLMARHFVKWYLPTYTY